MRYYRIYNYPYCAAVYLDMLPIWFLFCWVKFVFIQEVNVLIK